MIVFDFNDYSGTLVGEPPADFELKLKTAVRIHEILEAEGLKVDDDVFLLSALAAYQENNKNMGAFVQRTKQVVNWASGAWKKRLDALPEDGAQLAVSPIVLENKSVEIARQIFRCLYKDEGFLLFIFSQEPNRVAYVSSVGRADVIKLLKEHITFMEAEQGKQS